MVALGVFSTTMSGLTRPYLADAEDRTDFLNRLGTVVVIGTGAALDTKNMTKDHALLVLSLNSLWLLGMYAFNLRMLPLEAVKY